MRSALSDSHDKVKELESSLFLATEEKSSCAIVSDQELRKKCEKIANLERELEESYTRQAEIESELKTIVSLNKPLLFHLLFRCTVLNRVVTFRMICVM